MPDYINAELDSTRELFDLEELLAFTVNHRVEVMVQADCQYHCYIDYHHHKGAWAICLTPVMALVAGMRAFKENMP